MSKAHELATVASAIHALELAHSRIEALERENQQHLDYINTLCQEIKTEQRLSFRDQVARLERENAALEKRLQEIQRMCLRYQEEHAGLRKDAERMQWIVDNDVEACHLLRTTSGTFVRAAIDAAMKEQT